MEDPVFDYDQKCKQLLNTCRVPEDTCVFYWELTVLDSLIVTN